MFVAVPHALWSFTYSAVFTGPILFILYTADLVTLVHKFGLSPHFYANYTVINYTGHFEHKL